MGVTHFILFTAEITRGDDTAIFLFRKMLIFYFNTDFDDDASLSAI